MKLSILICSLESRVNSLVHLLTQLNYQIKDLTNVEILTNVDNKQKSTGKKRQELLSQAQGEYVVYIDDDDHVPSYYVSRFLEVLDGICDCVAINGTMTTNGANEIKWKLSKDYPNETIKENGVNIYIRKTNHITTVKREHAIKVGFPDKSLAEDKFYSDGINQYLKVENTIDLPMYHYDYQTSNKEY